MAETSRTQQNDPSDVKFRVGGEAAQQEQLHCPSCNGGNPSVAQNCMWCGRNLGNNGAATAYLGRYSASSGGQQIQPYQSGGNPNLQTLVYSGQGSNTTNVSPSTYAQTQVMPVQNQYPANPQYGQQVQQVQQVNQPAYPQYQQYPQYAQPPIVIHNTQTVVVAQQKSVGLAVFLSFLFGPLGMLYSTALGGTLIFFLNVFLLFTTFGTGWMLTWVVGMVWAAMAAQSHNSRAVTTYQQSVSYPQGYYQQP